MPPATTTSRQPPWKNTVTAAAVIACDSAVGIRPHTGGSFSIASRRRIASAGVSSLATTASASSSTWASLPMSSSPPSQRSIRVRSSAGLPKLAMIVVGVENSSHSTPRRRHTTMTASSRRCAGVP
jgi:hypothetical protein